MTPSQKLRSIADSTGLDGIADAIREIAEEIEHNNAPAVPQTVYLVENRTCLLAYASREDADKAVASMPASVGGGFLVSPVQVFGAPAPAVPQGDPTEEMLVAGLKECEPLGELIDWREGFWRSEMRAVWEAMLGATPAPAPAQEPVDMVPRAALHEVERERDWYKTRAQTMHEHQNGQVWYWQGDGEDHPETLVNSLPVVIRADQLRELIAKPAQEVGLTDEAVNDAAKVLAERFDYPWEHMPEEGRKNMRVQARAVVEAALRAKGGK